MPTDTSPPSSEEAHPSAGSDTDLNPEDYYSERVVSRVFLVSWIALAGLGALGLAVYFALHRPPAKASDAPRPLAQPKTPERPERFVPEAKFSNVTQSSGIRFVHNNGAYGDKLLPETMGGGCAFLDFDGDGDQDLLFINSTDWPWKAAARAASATSVLYRNDGHGTFEDVTAGSGLDAPFYGMGVAAGDYDNDGLPDLFVSAVGGNRLFHNEGGGHFRDVTATSGVAGAKDGWSSSCAWFDYDNDGDLDLLVANYVRWSREIDFEVNYTLVGLGRAYGQPMNFEGTFPELYRNEGSGRFTNVSAGAGLQVRNPSTGHPMAKSLGVATIDLDRDGWMDIVLADDTVQNLVFRNRHDGTFEEIGATTGIAFDSYGNSRGAMGIDTAHCRPDGCLALAIGNFANEMTALYVAAKPNELSFTDEAITEGIGPASRLPLKFGVLFLDYDLDGWPDLLTANGHLEEDISKVQASQQYAQAAQLFWNATETPARGGFVAVTPEKAGADLFHPIVGRGSAYADIDGDGDLDVVHTQVGGPPLLLRNDQGLGHHWVRLKLVGTRCNRDAIGAWIKAVVDGKTLWRHVTPTRSYLSQSELPVTLGLGAKDRLEALDIYWPDGSHQTISNCPVDRTTVVTQGH